MATQAGFLTIDKPAGPTSHTIVQRVRRLLGRGARVGHCGTLDPVATGLLLVAIGAATRLSRYLVGLDKEYRAVLRLGAATDTLDAEGRITEEAEIPSDLSAADVATAAATLVGEIDQVPPAYSAIRVEGQRLYERARRGEEVAVPSRRVRVHALSIEAVELPLVHFSTHVSSGTYVRSLARDIGAHLGLPAHLVALERWALGPFDLEGAIAVPESREALDAALRAPARALGFLPAARLDRDQVRRVRQGHRLATSELRPFEIDRGDGGVRLVDEDGELVAMAELRREDGAALLQPRVVLPGAERRD